MAVFLDLPTEILLAIIQLAIDSPRETHVAYRPLTVGYGVTSSRGGIHPSVLSLTRLSDLSRVCRRLHAVITAPDNDVALWRSRVVAMPNTDEHIPLPPNLSFRELAAWVIGYDDRDRGRRRGYTPAYETAPTVDTRVPVSTALPPPSSQDEEEVIVLGNKRDSIARAGRGGFMVGNGETLRFLDLKGTRSLCTLQNPPEKHPRFSEGFTCQPGLVFSFSAARKGNMTVRLLRGPEDVERTWEIAVGTSYVRPRNNNQKPLHERVVWERVPHAWSTPVRRIVKTYATPEENAEATLHAEVGTIYRALSTGEYLVLQMDREDEPEYASRLFCFVEGKKEQLWELHIRNWIPDLGDSRGLRQPTWWIEAFQLSAWHAVVVVRNRTFIDYRRGLMHFLRLPTGAAEHIVSVPVTNWADDLYSPQLREFLVLPRHLAAVRETSLHIVPFLSKPGAPDSYCLPTPFQKEILTREKGKVLFCYVAIQRDRTGRLLYAVTSHGWLVIWNIWRRKVVGAYRPINRVGEDAVWVVKGEEVRVLVPEREREEKGKGKATGQSGWLKRLEWRWGKNVKEAGGSAENSVE